MSPASAPMTPTTTPLARTTRRTFRSEAPSAPSIPSARSRRWASTVKPPTETRAMSSMPMVARASTMVSGLSGLLEAWARAVSTFGPSADGLAPGASNSTVTWVGAVTCPGATRANSSSRLCGFCTMPVTVRAWPPWCQTSLTDRPSVAARPGVSAT